MHAGIDKCSHAPWHYSSLGHNRRRHCKEFLSECQSILFE
ncbi:Uncharacterised protein [Vibrio cholerae]|nr:Uncharacterised protein [Vibrio cholerae]